MGYRALATDYDGTLATEGEVGQETVAALRRLLASGRRLLLVTGRQLDELLGIFSQVELFERVVAENAPCCITRGLARRRCWASALRQCSWLRFNGEESNGSPSDG